MNLFIQRLVEMFIDKKRIIGWVSAVALAIAAAAAGMQTKEFKDAVCAAPIIESAPQPQGTPVGK